MSGSGSGDDQSEDGELRQSPGETSKNKIEGTEYKSDDEDIGDMDALDIKPPQAKILDHKTKKREHERSRRKSDKNEKGREVRHSHRDKHHRDKTKSEKLKDVYQREKYYREKQQMFEQISYSEHHYVNERGFRVRKSEETRSRHDKKHGERKPKEDRRSDTRDLHERHVRYEEEKRDRDSKALADLRERLIEKRRGEDGYKSEKDSRRHRKYRHRVESHEDPLQGESGSYVKEILNITTEERKYKKERDPEKALTEEEKLEQEHRKEKLLEAEREMARLKEQSKVERVRRHLERVAKRKQQEEDNYSKRLKVEESVQIVTVSDTSDQENESDNSLSDKEDMESGESRSPSRSRSHSKSRSRSPSKSSSGEESAYSENRSRTKSRSRSPSSQRSQSSDRSKSRSPSEHREVEEEMLENKEDKEEKKVENKNEKDEKAAVTVNKINEDLPPYFPAVQGCRSVEEFKCLNKIEEGTYGVVYRAKDKRTDEIVALKRLKMEKEKEGFPITSLREINTLLKGQHANIVTVREIVVGSNMDKIFIVMDYVEHDLKSLMETMRHKKQTFMPGEIKCLLKQLLQAVAHLHDNWILHRDLKTSNLLLSHKGILKVGDFGLAREYGSPLKAYTPVVVTQWYRAPELLLCTKEYSTPIDMWSVGCIFAELLLMNPVFPGKSDVDQLNRIFKDLGTPSESIWPGFNELPAVKKMKFNEYPVSNLRGKFNTLSEVGLGLLIKFFTYDPVQRITAEDALKQAYFTEPPLPIDPAMFPTWPAKSELGQKRALAASPKPPSGGREYKKLGGEDDDGYGFRYYSDVRRGGAGFSLKF
ncbi:serine/threonine-protein kinase PITSLRE isoform X2 [Sitophilus oryzae]|uniref:cyclin-dependent kinase n=1 Tax=Sitophilus oryzae TaxID=7048 RepID=A0A6J2Y7B3_SITOR|nr:serine/threonine-protein kinase PITSLRE isoform X2 [Sitophilus oryzae]